MTSYTPRPVTWSECILISVGKVTKNPAKVAEGEAKAAGQPLPGSTTHGTGAHNPTSHTSGEAQHGNYGVAGTGVGAGAHASDNTYGNQGLTGTHSTHGTGLTGSHDTTGTTGTGFTGTTGTTGTGNTYSSTGNTGTFTSTHEHSTHGGLTGNNHGSGLGHNDPNHPSLKDKLTGNTNSNAYDNNNNHSSLTDKLSGNNHNNDYNNNNNNTNHSSLTDKLTGNDHSHTHGHSQGNDGLGNHGNAGFVGTGQGYNNKSPGAGVAPGAGVGGVEGTQAGYGGIGGENYNNNAATRF